MTENKIFGFSVKELVREVQKKPAMLGLFLGLIGLGIFLLMNNSDRGDSPHQNIQSNSETTVTEPEGEKSTVYTQQQIEVELTKTLEAIAGAGKVRVEVSLKSGARRIWERQSHIDKKVSQEQGAVNTEENNSDEMVLAKDRDGRDSPILREEIAPEIQGVIIVATGARNTEIKELLTRTVMTILDLPAHRVMVIPGEIAGEAGQK